MTPRAAFLAAVCLLIASACAADGPDAFSVGPEPRGFELPARPVILFYVDGLRADVLDDLARQGALPRLQRHLLERAAHPRSAVSCVPSVTYTNAVSMMTGCWPSRNGAWSNTWFDRRQLRTRNYEDSRDSAGDDVDCATIFELLSDEVTAAVALPFERGAKISRVQSARTGGILFGFSWITGREKAADSNLVEQFQDIAVQARRIGVWPAFIGVYVPAADDVGHEEGSDSAAYRDAVAHLDEAIGGLLEAFQRDGMLDDLTIVLTSDHGHHPAPYSLDLQTYLTAALATPVVVGAENDGETAFVERWLHYAPARVVAVANGYRQSSLHLRAAEDWSERPSLEQILSFPGGPEGPAPDERLPDRLASPAVGLIAVRAGEDEARVYSSRGSAAIRRTAAHDDSGANGGANEPLFAYEVLDGRDPLEYDADEGLRAWMRSPHTSREWLEATAETSRPDVVPQLLTAFDDPGSGDVILFAAPGWDFSPAQYVGGHGGLEREELIVPLYIAGPGIRAGELPAARLVDIVPTLVELAGVRAEPSDFDGVSLARELGAAPAPEVASDSEGRP